MNYGRLNFKDVEDNQELIAPATKRAIVDHGLSDVLVAEVDPSLSDSAMFCKMYDIAAKDTVNCVVVEVKRSRDVRYAACLVLVADRLDINNVIRRHFNARKVSCAPIETVVTLTAMEHGGITPIGLSDEWPVLVDESVASAGRVVIGGGVRNSKLLVAGDLLAQLPNATVLDIKKY